MYVATEDAFPAKRLQELADSFSKRHLDMKYCTKQFTDAIFIEHSATLVSFYVFTISVFPLFQLLMPPPPTQSSLSALLEFKLPSLLKQHTSVRLVVIDSLAALFRVEFSGSQARQRAQLLRAFGSQLQQMSSRHSLAIVCCNQVSLTLSNISVVWSWYVFLGTALRTECRTVVVVPRPMTVSLAIPLLRSSVKHVLSS